MINTVNEQTTGREVNIAQNVSYTINNNTAFYSQETWGARVETEHEQEQPT